MNPISHAPTNTTVKVVRMPMLVQNNAEEAAQELAQIAKERRKAKQAKVKNFQNRTKTRVHNAIQETQKQKKERDERIKENIYRTLKDTNKKQKNQIKAKLEMKKSEKHIYELDRQMEMIFNNERQMLQQMLDYNPNNNKTVQFKNPPLIVDMKKTPITERYNNNNNNNNNLNIDSNQSEPVDNEHINKNEMKNEKEKENVNDLNDGNNEYKMQTLNDNYSKAIEKRNEYSNHHHKNNDLSMITNDFDTQSTSSNETNKTNESDNNNRMKEICCDSKHRHSSNKPFWDRGINNNDDKLTEKERKALFGAIKQWHLMQDRMQAKANAI